MAGLPDTRTIGDDKHGRGSRYIYETDTMPTNAGHIVPPEVSSYGTPAPGQPHGAIPPGYRPPAATAGADFGQHTGAAGRPQQGIAVAQSEPTPQVNKPPFDPRPYAWVAKHDPQLRTEIDQAAELTGVDPTRIAWHAWKESKFQQDDNGKPVRGADGEIGMMQLMPGTAQEFSAGGQLDPFSRPDNVLIGARYIAQMDARFGRNSPSSFAAYNGGPGGVRSSKAQAYAQSAFPRTHLKASDFVGEGSTTPSGLVQAGSQGPDQFLRYVVETAPAGMPVSDAWRHAEALLVGAYLEKGDLTGAQHARDFIMQMSHVGTNQYLMAAHQALSAGDGVSAAQYLAKAHAFFPDGTIGRFKSNGKDVYAERVDEHDPSRHIGSPFMVSADDVAGLLNQTTDPQQFLKTLRDQQEASAATRLKEQMGAYYADLPQQRRQTAALEAETRLGAAEIGAKSRQAAAETAAQSRQQAAQTSANARVEAATISAQNRGGGSDAANQRAIDKEAGTLFGSLPGAEAPTPEDLEQRGSMSEIYSEVRRNGAAPPQAERAARGLFDKTLQLVPLTDGNYGVVKAGEKGAQPFAYISKALGDRIAGTPPAAAGALPTSPVGAGAGSPAAVAAGVGSNLSGTTLPQQQVPLDRSSAIPVR